MDITQSFDRELERLEQQSLSGKGWSLDDMRLIALIVETKQKLTGDGTNTIRIIDDRVLREARRLSTEEALLQLENLIKKQNDNHIDNQCED